VGLNTSQYESLRGRALVIWLVITLSMLRIASWVSGQIILIHAYGWGRVSREHLQMARLKPLLVISNGDVLPYSPFVHYIIGVAIWLPSAVLLVVLAFKLLPQPYREAMKGGRYEGRHLRHLEHFVGNLSFFCPEHASSGDAPCFPRSFFWPCYF
jgi:hypothetical protein